MNNTIPKDTQHYSRRHWLQLASLAATAGLVPGKLLGMAGKSSPYKYHVARLQNVPFLLPENKTVPFNWPVGEVPVQDSSIVFNWPKKFKYNNKNIRFRITSATDIREECTLSIASAATGQKIGIIDIRFAHYMQPFELVILPAQFPLIIAEGIAVKMIKGTKPFWFFVEAADHKEIPDAYLPHLLVSDSDTKEEDAWKKRLLSLASLSTFGWMEGCVLDGISMMAEKNKSANAILKQHLDKYFANNTLIYANLVNQRSAEKITTVESILPFAMLAMENPQHAMLQTAIDFCTAHADEAGVIADETGTNRRLKTEECYTISYPLAILSKMLYRADLQKMAISNLEARVKLLSNNDFIYQNGKESEKPNFGNWARGVGWYLLGLAKTLAVLPETADVKMLRSALQKGAEIAIRYQQPNGLWTCFLHQRDTGIETSGSASISAALAYGYSQNLLPASCREAAKKCAAGLNNYFTPDGFLTGTTQVNKGGEGLQRNGFRVISPYTLGFVGILETSLLSA